MANQQSFILYIRPLSVMNTDTKLYIYTLASRLKPFMTSLVHENQTDFLKNCLAADNIRHHLYVMEILDTVSVR